MKIGVYTCPKCQKQNQMGTVDEINQNKLLTTTYCQSMDSGVVLVLGVDPLPSSIVLSDPPPKS